MTLLVKWVRVTMASISLVATVVATDIESILCHGARNPERD